MSKRVHLTIRGRVQGVSFRAYTRKGARALGVTGWVRNRNDGSVELVAEGDDARLRDLLAWCQEGSPWAHVDHIETRWDDATGEYTDFVVATTH